MTDINYITFEQAVKKEDIPELNKVYGRIAKFVCAKKNVPYSLIEKLYQFIKDPEELQDDLLTQDCKEKTEKALEYFTKQKGYNFNDKVLYDTEIDVPKYDANDKIIGVSKKAYTKYSLEEMIYHCFSLNTNSGISKNETIKLFYDTMVSYKKPLSNKTKKQLTNYKLGVIAAYLTHLQGFKLFYKSDKINNEKLFQLAKYAIKKAHQIN